MLIYLLGYILLSFVTWILMREFVFDVQYDLDYDDGILASSFFAIFWPSTLLIVITMIFANWYLWIYNRVRK